MLIGEIKCNNDMERFHDLNDIISTHIKTLKIPNSIWKIFSMQFITYANKNTAQKYIVKLHKFYEYYIQKCLPKIEQIDDLLNYAELYIDNNLIQDVDILHKNKKMKWGDPDKHGIVSNEVFAPNAHEPDTRCVIS